MAADVERALPRGPEGGEVGAIQSGWRLALREFSNNKLAVVGFGILVFFVLYSFVGPLIYHTDQLDTNPTLNNSRGFIADKGTMTLQGPFVGAELAW